MSKLNNKILNLITSISLLLLVYSLFVLREIKPEGYAVNIYEQLPFHFFLILLLCYLSACFVLLAYKKSSAILALMLVHVIVLIIPYMLGYASIGRGNDFLYPGLAISTGFSETSCLSTFPGLSPTGPLLVSTLSLASGLGAQGLSHFLPILFSIIFITGMYLFYRGFMSREKLVSATFLSSVIPYFGHFQVSTVSYYLTFCLVPLYLLLLWNAISGKNRMSMIVCLLFMMPLLLLAHPFIFAYLLFFALLLTFAGKVTRSGLLKKVFNLNNFSRDPLSGSSGKIVPLFVFLLFISGSLVLCVKYASGFINTLFPFLVRRIETLISAGFATIPSMESGIFEFIHLFNLYYGKYYIPLIFIIINTIIVWQNRKRFCHHFVRRYPRFLLLYIVSFLLELVFLLNPFVSYPADRFVNMSFIIFAQIPLLGYSIYIVLLRKGYPTGLGAAILVLGFLWTLGFFSCFSSPHAGGISEAVPQNEVEGVKWLVESKAAYPYVLSPGEKSIYTFSGTSSSNQGQFDAYCHNSASPGSNKPFYLIVTTFSEAMGLERLKESETEHYPAENDPEAQEGKPLYKIYDSLNIRIYQNTP